MLRLAVGLLSAVAFAGLSANADAADMIVKAPITKAPPKPELSGNLGIYLGVFGAYDWGRATFSDATGSTSINVPSGLAGFTVGYNVQSARVVYGVETDIAVALRTTKTNWTAAPCFGCEVRLTYFGTLRGRLGYAVGQALPYVTAGLAYGGVETGLAGGSSENNTKAGWTAGGGIEYAIFNNWSVKTEYLYFDLGKTNCSVIDCGAPVSVKFRGNMVKVGTNLRF